MTKQPIAFLGDIHGDRWGLERAVKRAAADGCCALVQVGDCGVRQLDTLPVFEVPVYWCDGNHEHWRWLKPYLNAAAPLEVSPNFTYVPRGLTLTVGGWRLGFLGGASSVDKVWQQRVGNWDACETLRPEQAARLAGPVDVLVAHTTTQEVIDRYFDPRDLQRYFDLEPTWRDPSATIVEATWRRLGEPPLVCGHMHRALQHGAVRVLNIDEYAVWCGGWR